MILTSALASEWPQYRGSNHDGTSTDPILKQWPASGLKPDWQIPLTNGFSSFSASQGLAYTLVTRKFSNTNAETCLALDIASGREIWATPVGKSQYQGGTGNPGDGPRSTPTVDGSNVYTSSAHMNLYCLRTNDGGVVWSKNLISSFGARNIDWQNAASPLIDGDLLFINANTSTNSLLALDKRTGQKVWLRQSEKMTHSTPVAATILGVRQIVFFAQSGLVSVAPLTGDVLWRYAFAYNRTSAGASPVVADDIVYCAATYGAGSAAVRLSMDGANFVVTELWRISDESMGNHWSTPVHYQGYLYGIYGHYGTGILKCLELATGRVCWSAANLRTGGVLIVDNSLLILEEDGDLCLAEPNPTAYTEIARGKILSGTSWNSPAIYNGRILARSTTGGVCVNLSAKPAAQPVRLQMPPASATGPYRLVVKNADGSAMNDQRTNQIVMWSATNLLTPFSNWLQISSPWISTNGQLQLDAPPETDRPQSFFRTTEQ